MRQFAVVDVKGGRFGFKYFLKNFQKKNWKSAKSVPYNSKCSTLLFLKHKNVRALGNRWKIFRPIRKQISLPFVTLSGLEEASVHEHEGNELGERFYWWNNLISLSSKKIVLSLFLRQIKICHDSPHQTPLRLTSSWMKMRRKKGIKNVHGSQWV